MANNSTLKECIWLINLLIDRDDATYDTIKEKWDQRFCGEPLYKEKLRRRKMSIESMFDIHIECHPDDYHYYLAPHDKRVLQSGAREWIMGSIIAGEWLTANSKHFDKIALEDVPTGQRHLAEIFQSIDSRRQLFVRYHKFTEEGHHEYNLCPYGIKLFMQRWYLVALSPKGDIRTYGIDRIKECALTDIPYDIPADFTLKDHFADYYGIYHDETLPLTEVTLRTYGITHHYLETLPLHPSQEVTARGPIPEGAKDPTYVDFRYTIRPTYDFRQKLFMIHEDTEVLSPQWLRDEMRGKLRRTLARYDATHQSSPPTHDSTP